VLEHVKRFANVALGVVTSIGGFVEAGSISTAVQAGSLYGFRLLWAIALAAALLAALCEMSGRLSALSGRTYAEAVRERFGFHVQLALLVGELLIDGLLLTAELGGAAIALQLLTGLSARVCLPFVVTAGGILILAGGFSVIEDGLGLLGLVTLVFLVAAWRLRPAWPEAAAGFLPTVSGDQPARYAFLAISIVGATISPYLINFYSSGAAEEEWSERDLLSNRVTAFFGMGFGAVVSMGALVAAAIVFGPLHEDIQTFGAAARLFEPVFGSRGIPLFAMALGVGCFGAAVEIALNAGYVMAQGFGWTWGANKRRQNAARFSVAALGMLGVAFVAALFGFNPLTTTLVSVSLTVVLMPLVVLPMLVIMNDARYVRDHRNGLVGNVLLATLTLGGAVLAIIVLPLQITGH
jgi:Mn2+/Fe2+ NRAMP family transporter